MTMRIDPDEEVTQVIPVMSLDEMAAEWRAEMAAKHMTHETT